MNERIREFLISENKSSAQFAEEIGVQPSGISHILSGRNKPSLDFVLKMLEKYRNISTDWLLFGIGPMYKEGNAPSLFDSSAPVNHITDSGPGDKTNSERANISEAVDQFETIKHKEQLPGLRKNIVVKIVWFYDNNSFEEFFPSN